MNQQSDTVVDLSAGRSQPVVGGRAAALTGAFVVLASVAGALPSFSTAAYAMVLTSGGVLFCVGLIVPSRRPRPARLTGQAAWWLLPMVLLAATEAVTFLLGSGPSHPTLSKIADPLLDGYLPRAALFLAWLGGFWGLARR